MKTIHVEANQSGQRLDKLLRKALPQAPDSFLYKMLRKKNIVLNGRKAEGREILREGDEIRLFLSEDTLEKFSGTGNGQKGKESGQYQKAWELFSDMEVLYEDNNILLVNKPAGVLTQKAEAGDLSLNEWLVGRLLHTEEITQQELSLFRPSVCNRLDRNTSGLVLCGKSLAGSQELSRLLRERKVHKFYRTIVVGCLSEPGTLEGLLSRDREQNKVTIQAATAQQKSTTRKSQTPASKSTVPKSTVPKSTVPKSTEGVPVKIRFRPLSFDREYSYLEVELVTGKTHQIRAQLADAGHPLIGDGKYGISTVNLRCRDRWELKSQLLHSYRLEFAKEIEGVLKPLAGRSFVAPLPAVFTEILSDIHFEE